MKVNAETPLYLVPGGMLRVLFLPGTPAVLKEYDKEIDHIEALATFAAMDRHLLALEQIPKSRAEPLGPVASGKLWEVKAPPVSKDVIGRLLCYCPQGWNFFVALARKKKTQQLPDEWKRTAIQRIQRASERGRS